MTSRQWQLPPIHEILDEVTSGAGPPNVLSQKRIIEKTLAELGVEVQITQIQPGPRGTQFSLGRGVQLSKVQNLDQDLAVALSGVAVQIIPPTSNNPSLGILVPHHGPQTAVNLRQILATAPFKQKSGTLKIALGGDISGRPVVIDLVELPHLLIGGTTGSGKSTCLHAIIAGLLCNYPPNVLQLLLIDPLAIELKPYANLPHLFAPVVTRSSQALDTLTTVDKVIERRYNIFSEQQARNIASYNDRLVRAGKDTIPHIVIIIDNVFDLMMSAAGDVEQIITRMAQRGRGAGIHLILSTPRAHTEALSGTIKANFPARIAFRVMGPAESRLILDHAGAEELLGHGDMLYKAPNTTELQRVQGVFVSEAERKRIVEFWRS